MVPSVVPLADRAIGNLQQWLIGTYHGVSQAQLQVYLDEFVFTIVAASRWPPFKRCSVWGLDARRRPIDGFEALGTSPVDRNMLGSAETTG